MTVLYCTTVVTYIQYLYRTGIVLVLVLVLSTGTGTVRMSIPILSTRTYCSNVATVYEFGKVTVRTCTVLSTYGVLVYLYYCLYPYR